MEPPFSHLPLYLRGLPQAVALRNAGTKFLTKIDRVSAPSMLSAWLAPWHRQRFLEPYGPKGVARCSGIQLSWVCTLKPTPSGIRSTTVRLFGSSEVQCCAWEGEPSSMHLTLVVKRRRVRAR